MPQLDARVLAAWAATGSLHEPGPPAVPGALEAAEQAVGRRLPGALRELYQRHDGGRWLSGNLVLLPFRGNELSIARHSTALRTAGWPVPAEVVTFGDNGGDEVFGLWLPSTAARPLVVQIGSIFEPGCMGIVGEDVSAFLRLWTAYHLLLPEDREAATPGLDALDVPHRLRSEDPDDEVFEQIFAWASPTIPVALRDPYTAQLTPEDVGRLAATG